MRESERAVKRPGGEGKKRGPGGVRCRWNWVTKVYSRRMRQSKSVSRDSVRVSVFGRGEERRNEGRLVWKSERGEVEGMPAVQHKRETELLEIRATAGAAAVAVGADGTRGPKS